MEEIDYIINPSSDGNSISSSQIFGCESTNPWRFDFPEDPIVESSEPKIDASKELKFNLHEHESYSNSDTYSALENVDKPCTLYHSELEDGNILYPSEQVEVSHYSDSVSSEDLNSNKIASISWDNFVGLDDIKDALKYVTSNNTMYRITQECRSVLSPMDFLFFGLKGCGKTLLVRALSSHCAANLILIDTKELLEKYVSVSEDIISRLEKSVVSVICFKDIDSIVEKQQLFFKFMKEAILKNKVVFFVGITEKLNLITEIMQIQAFNHLIFVPLPNIHQREEIFKFYLKDYQLSEALSYALFAEETDLCSSKDIENICTCARQFASKTKILLPKHARKAKFFAQIYLNPLAIGEYGRFHEQLLQFKSMTKNILNNNQNTDSVALSNDFFLTPIQFSSILNKIYRGDLQKLQQDNIKLKIMFGKDLLKLQKKLRVLLNETKKLKAINIKLKVDRRIIDKRVRKAKANAKEIRKKYSFF